MNSLIDAPRLDPAGKQSYPRTGPLLSRMVSGLFGLPDKLGVAITVVSAFALTVIMIAFLFGAPLSLPRERTSAALGVSAVLPVAIALVAYLTIRTYKAVAKKIQPGDPSLLRVVGVDLTFMSLFVAATYFHFSLKTWVQVINPNRYDEAYFAVDTYFRPIIDVFYWIRSSFFTLVPNTDAWYQAAFLLMFISGFCCFSVTRHPVFPRFCIGVLLIMSLGGLSYLIAPALGPFIFEQGLNAEATQAQAGMLKAHQEVMRYGMIWIETAGPHYFTGALAAMPSLHIAHAVVMTYYAVVARSALVPFFFFFCFWIVIESVVSRWHYLIDLPFGLLLAAFVIWLTNLLCRETYRKSQRSG